MFRTQRKTTAVLQKGYAPTVRELQERKSSLTPLTNRSSMPQLTSSDKMRQRSYNSHERRAGLSCSTGNDSKKRKSGKSSSSSLIRLVVEVVLMAPVLPVSPVEPETAVAKLV